MRTLEIARLLLSSILLLAVATAGWEPAQARASAGVASEDPAGLTSLEQRGKQIYLTGESPGGEPVTALMGDAGIEVPASTLPCANCHGRDGTGNPEGGVSPSNLTWEALTKPYGVRHGSGREHPPYTLRLLKRAIAMGIDPAGNDLHLAMPRYRMSLEDMEALVAYIRKLGTDRDPGITADTLHLGTVLPPGGRGDLAGEAVDTVLRAYFDRINQEGGLYNRRVEIHRHVLAAHPDRAVEGLVRFLEETPLFALVGGVLIGSEERITEVVRDRQVPWVGPATLYPQTGFPVNRQVFYLLSGLPTQMEVLAELAVQRHADRASSERGVGSEAGSPEPLRAAVVLPANDRHGAAVEALESRAGELGLELATHRLEPPGSVGAAPGASPVSRLAGKLAEAGVEQVFLLLPPAEAVALVASAAEIGWMPEVYAPAVLGGSALLETPAGFGGRLFVSFPTGPGDRSGKAMERYGELAAEYELPRRGLTFQLSNLAAAEVLVEGLKRAGRDLSRERLIEALEELYDHRTGWTPPLTYNPNRRIGALGAWVVTLDPETGNPGPVGSFRQPGG